MYGKERENFSEAFTHSLGKDSWWWLIPTYPAINYNYLEKIYTKKEFKRMIKEK